MFKSLAAGSNRNEWITIINTNALNNDEPSTTSNNEEDEQHPKKKEKTLSGIKKTLNKNHMFQCLTRHAGKGKRDSIRRLHRANEKQKIIATYVDRPSIEKK